MANFDNIIQEINTNIPDNTTQAITAAKMRTTLIDFVNEVESNEDNLETSIQNKQDTLTFDSTPTENSTNPVTSGGVYGVLKNTNEEVDTLTEKVNTFEFEPVAGDNVTSQFLNVMEKYVNSSSTIVNSTAGDTVFYISYLPVANEERTVNIKQVVTGSYSHPIGCIFLLDSASEIVAGTVVNSIVAPLSSGVNTDVIVTIPANKILCVSRFNYNNRETFSANIVEYQSSVINDIEEDINSIKGKTDKLVEEYEYTDIYSEAIEVEGNLGFSGTSGTTIISVTQSYWRIIYFPAKEQDWKLKLQVNHNNTTTLSYRIGCTFLVDDPSQIVAGLNVSSSMLELGIRAANSSINEILDIPAGKYVAVSTTTYQPTLNTFAFYEASLTFGFLNDIENLQETKLDTIKTNPDYVSINPLEITKETAGYTAIFRNIGVIGGSMSTGWHSHNTGSVSANMPEFSTLQFIARLCGSTGYNFSRGGMSARSWPQNDMIDNPYDENKKCQMYLVQLGNNDLAYHSDHPEYTLGTITDLTPTGGTSISDYTYNTGTFYGNMARIINEVRKIQPRAYVFLSTFLKGYGTIPADFDYNEAIRNIYSYYTENDGENKPAGDELHYYLIDYYTYGHTYSYFNSGIHSGTVIGSHLVASGYLLWAYDYCTYIDWIIKNNMSQFNDVAFVGTDDYQ